jgi:hypothetical protein
VKVRNRDHTCHFGPVCDQSKFAYNGSLAYIDDDAFDCGHASCQQIMYEECRACEVESMDDDILASEYCDEGCGWQVIIRNGGGAGMGGMGSVYWADLACGHQNFAESL